MPVMLAKVRVADFEKWKPVFDEGEKARREQGLTGHEVYRDATEPNVVVLVFHVRDLNRAKEFAGSEGLRSSMARAGVEGRPEVWFLNDVEVKQY